MTNRIRSIRKSQNLTLDVLAESTGLSSSYLSRLESGGRGGSLEAMIKISRALRVPVTDLTDEFTEQDILATIPTNRNPKPRKSAAETSAPMPVIAPTMVPIDVPVYGTAAASVTGRGAFILSSNIVDYAARPPALQMAPDLYALEVRGDSMSPKYEPGDIVFVHPHRLCRAGDTVIIQEPDADNGETQAFIKIYLSETTEVIVARQLNPDTRLEFKKRDGLQVHKVLSSRELFGF